MDTWSGKIPYKFCSDVNNMSFIEGINHLLYMRFCIKKNPITNLVPNNSLWHAVKKLLYFTQWHLWLNWWL